MIFNGGLFNKQTIPINIGVGDVIGNAQEVRVKMGHTHFYNNNGNSLEKLMLKGVTLKESPADTVSECKVDDHYFKCSCDDASSELTHFKTGDKDFLEVRRTSVYHSSSSHRKFWLGASEEPKGEGKVDSQSNPKANKDFNGRNYTQRHAMDGMCELEKGENDYLVTEESSNMYLNSMAKDKKLETEDLIRNMSNLPHYLQRTEKGESFQERALRFGVLEWSLLEKWNHNRGKEQRNFHSPSGSDTSSSFSTLESSSFSCRSDLSSSAKREMSPSSSLHTYFKSPSVSSTNLHCLSHSSSPTRGRERRASCVEGSRHGSKEISLKAQIKTNCKDTHYEYLDLKHLQEKVVENQGSKLEFQKDTHAPLEKELSFSVHKTLDHSRFSGPGMGNDDGVHRSKTEQGSNSVFELPKEQWFSVPATPGFFSAGDRSPETCSEVSLNLENVSVQFGENSKSLSITGSNQVGSLEDDVNIHFVDCLDELPAAHADGGNIQTGYPSLLDKCAASAPDPSPQKVVPDISISSKSDQNLICLDDYGCIFQAPQGCMLPNSSAFPVDNDLVHFSGNSVHLRTDSNDALFHRSQSAYNELQSRNKDTDILVKPAGAFSDQHLPETVATNEFLGVSRIHKNRRAKSFSLSGIRDHAINDHLTAFMTPKSFSVRPDACPCHCGLSKDGCKACKKVSASPLRRWIDPIVKSRGRNRMDVSSRAPLQSDSLHREHDADGVLNSNGGIRTNISLRKSLAQGFSRASHKTSRISSVRSTSPSQTFVASNNDISGKHFLHISRSRCSSPGPKHEKILEKLSQFVLETDFSCSSMPAPPANPPILQGLLHFKYKNGLPYFTFSLNESEEVLVAKTWKIDKPEGRDFDWMYSFHSGQSHNMKRNKSGWGSWGRKDNHIPDLVGNMKVSSSLCSKLNSYGNVEHLVETEFVLFGTNKGNTKQDPIMQREYTENSSFSPSQTAHSEVSPDVPLSNSSSVSTTSSTSVPGDNMESIIPRNMVPPKHSDRKNEMHRRKCTSALRQNFRESCQSSSVKSRSEGRNASQGTWKEPDILDSDMILSSHFCPDLELAALVIKVPLEWRESVKCGQGEDALSNKFGGWGLKFLVKSSGGLCSETALDYQMNLPPPELDDDSKCPSLNLSINPTKFGNISMVNSFLNSERCSFENGSSESSDIHLSCGTQGHTTVTVIIPADIHGQPSTNSGGPSPLIERWRSSGSCDCGGWDLGCPLTILDNQNPYKNSLSESNVEGEGFRLSDMFIQANQGTPALSLAVVHDGLYLLRFHAQLSALQAFSIGVAMLHSRESFMPSKETKIQASFLRSSHVPPVKQVRTLSQAISTPHDDIQISMPNNHDIFFASCVPDPPLSPFGRV